MPVLLRRARATYGRAMRSALVGAGFADIPVNGLYILGTLDLNGAGYPFSQLVSGLGISKQAAGQLVDILVVRGYLSRQPDINDRRKMIIALTPDGCTAAKVQRSARDRIDEEFAASVGDHDAVRVRRALIQMIQIGERASCEESDTFEEVAPLMSAKI